VVIKICTTSIDLKKIARERNKKKKILMFERNKVQLEENN
jgi:hypothetical protein|tara:strand:+ start:2038 stop:2157 length:120 start_codon:yes stop_codon:yes gene_type:complete